MDGRGLKKDRVAQTSISDWWAERAGRQARKEGAKRGWQKD